MHVFAFVAVFAISLQKVLANDPVSVAVQEVVNDFIIVDDILGHWIESWCTTDFELGAELPRNRVVGKDHDFISLALREFIIVGDLSRVEHGPWLLIVLAQELTRKILQHAHILLPQLLLNVRVLRQLTEHTRQSAGILRQSAEKGILHRILLVSPAEHRATHRVEPCVWVEIGSLRKSAKLLLVWVIAKVSVVGRLLLGLLLLFLLFDFGALKLLHH